MQMAKGLDTLPFGLCPKRGRGHLRAWGVFAFATGREVFSISLELKGFSVMHQ